MLHKEMLDSMMQYLEMDKVVLNEDPLKKSRGRHASYIYYRLEDKITYHYYHESYHNGDYYDTEHGELIYDSDREKIIDAMIDPLVEECIGKARFVAEQTVTQQELMAAGLPWCANKVYKKYHVNYKLTS